MTSADARHKRILRRQLRNLGVGVAALLFGLVSVFGWNQYSTQQYENDAQVAHVYRVIEGSESRRGLSPSEKLAQDIHQMIETAENPQELSDALDGFVARPNQYANIEEELGYSPFDGSQYSCASCGELSPEMKARIEMIADGQAEQLIAQELDLTEPGINYTNIAIGSGLYLLLLSTGALALAIRHDSKQHRYDSHELNWRKTDHGSVGGAYKKLSKRLAPGYRIVLAVQGARGVDYMSLVRKIGLESEYERLQELRKTLEDSTADEDRKLLTDIDQLLALVDEQAGITAQSSKAASVTAAEQEQQQRMAQIRSEMRDIADKIQGRQVAREEVQGM